MFDMAASPCIQCRIDPQLKLRLQAIAVERGIDRIGSTQAFSHRRGWYGADERDQLLAIEPIRPRARVYVRLRRRRSRAPSRTRRPTRIGVRDLRSMLVRTHLRKSRRSPIASSPSSGAPSARWARSVGILNQIARVAHQTGRVEGLTTADLRAMLAAFEELRAHFKRLIEANIASWETDHAKTSH